MASGTMQGSGTYESPYLVEDALDLKAIETYGYDKYYLQTNDITLGTFEAIGNASGSGYVDFTGTYDGGNYIIKNGDITVVSGDFYNGIFARINSGEVKNVIIDNVNGELTSYSGLLAGEINNSRIYNITIRNCTILWFQACSYVGCLCGYLYSTYKFEDISIENVYMYSLAYNTNYVGFLAGKQYQGYIINCSVNSDSKILCYSGNYIGGITGEVERLGDIMGCLNESFIDNQGGACSYAGGIVGRCLVVSGNVPDLWDCKNTGQIYIDGSYVGGIAGYGNADINKCINTGNISADSNCGGIVGFTASDSNIVDCYALNTTITRIAGTNTGFGRVAGNTTYITVTDNFALSTMVISEGWGTFIGDDGTDVTDANAKKWATYDWEYSKWLIVEDESYPYLGTQTNDYSSTSGYDGIDITSANGKLEANYDTWNFTTTWNIFEGYTYPWMHTTPCLITDDFTYKKYFNQAIRATWPSSDSNTYTILKEISLNLNTYDDGTIAYTDKDYIGLFFYVSDENMFFSTTYATVWLESSAGNLAEYSIDSSNHTLVQGWNKYLVLKSDLIETGYVDWTSIQKIYFQFDIASSFENEYVTLGIIALIKDYSPPLPQGIDTSDSPTFSGLTLLKNTEPSTSPADQITLFATTDADTTLGLRTEANVIASTPTCDSVLAIKINGTTYNLLLEQA